MREYIIKPIQSFLFLLRHFSGERRAALSPVFLFWIVLFGIVPLISTAVAQPETAEHQRNEEELDILFGRIMQEIPDDVRERMDRASMVQGESLDIKKTIDPEDKSHQNRHKHINLRKNENMNELPEALQLQVERTISEFQKRKEERKAKFRESKRRR